jgi:hypothetical protein
VAHLPGDLEGAYRGAIVEGLELSTEQYYGQVARRSVEPWGSSRRRILARLYTGDYLNGWPEIDAYLSREDAEKNVRTKPSSPRLHP